MENFNEIEEVEKVISKIRESRKEKGYSHDVMAVELGISPSAYNKIERMESKLTLERFLQIKKILEKDYSDFFDIKTDKIFNQTFSEQQSFGNVEHFYQDNKEVFEKLIQAKDEQIALLKSLIK
ncbi:DNA-binding transcriptional regulator, XRE-family HTH domain [Paenimyroides aquimaris]|uniref:DNA-binding transcriptional regulator, XRE-family HTH domain n=1 Tax=Paenimyroides marinum TaxID=1159016 RepID=A0A1H6MFG1_9FLAO|nr:helix-turn-helix transcriptional regulator [Paenimyroides aquimaris]SEI00244.1 DNA-binding transcriptional regulator, XRE-family HTH domain [Paenimyroides aquimaris]